MFRKHHNPTAEKVVKHTQNSSRFGAFWIVLKFLAVEVLLHSPSHEGCLWFLVVHISLAACCHLTTEPNSLPFCALQRTQNLQSWERREFKICQAPNYALMGCFISNFYYWHQAWAISISCGGLWWSDTWARSEQVSGPALWRHSRGVWAKPTQHWPCFLLRGPGLPLVLCPRTT